VPTVSRMLAWGVALRLLLDASLVLHVSEMYAYAGFRLDLDMARLIESWLAYLVILLAAPKQLRRPSDLLVLMLLFGMAAPAGSLYALMDLDPRHFLLLNAAIWVVLLTRTCPIFSVAMVRGGALIAIGLLLAMALVTTVWMIQAGALSRFNLRFDRVYEVRRAVPAELGRPPLTYLVIWCVKVVGPGLLAICLWRRRYSAAVCIFALQVLWYGLTSHKAVLFYPLYAVFLWAWFRSRSSLWIVPAAIAGVVAVSLALALASLDTWAASLFIRRSLLVVARTVFQWMEFFEPEPMLLWSYSFGAAFVEYPYELNPARVVGESLGTASHVNTSFIGSGYAQAGVLGLLMYAVLVGLILRIIDSVASRGIPVWVATAVMIVPMESLLLASDLPTALLSHGVAFGLLVLLLLRSNGGDRARGASLRPLSECLVGEGANPAARGSSGGLVHENRGVGGGPEPGDLRLRRPGRGRSGSRA